VQANYPAKSTASVKPTTPGKKTVQPEENHSPGKAALPAATTSPAPQARIFLSGYVSHDPEPRKTRHASTRAPPTSIVPTEENIPDDGLTVPTRQTSARAPVNSQVNVKSVQSLTIRNLQASLDRLQKKATATTAKLGVARKQGEEGAARLHALEAQMSRVFPRLQQKREGQRHNRDWTCFV
jgi:hypothetical protein